MEQHKSIDDVHRRIFAAMLSNLDDSVGSVMNCLAENKLKNDTIVFFLSDNGGPTRELTSSNLPLKGEKGSMYEGGIRIPFLMSWPNHVPQQHVFERPVISLDIFATAARAAGVPDSTIGRSDGVDLLPFVTGEITSPPHEALFWRTGAKAALRHGDWKLLRNADRKQPNNWQLYDLAADNSETNDLATSNPSKLDELTKIWKSINAEMIDPVWNPTRK